MTFIRVPCIERVSKEVEVLAEFQGKTVAARYKNQTAVGFHPELAEDTTFYDWWLS